MLKLNVQVSGLVDVQRLMASVERQLPFAMSNALNNTAFAVRDAEVGEIVGTFDRPVSFVVRSPRVEKATKRRLWARVYIDERIQNALIHHVESGPRLPRDVARLLRGRGVLRGGEYTTYAPGFADSRGNVSLARWKRIVAELGRRGGKYFLATIRGQKAIWQRKGRGGKQIAPAVFIVSGAPRYRDRFDFYGAAQREADRVFERNFDRALDAALRSAR